MAHFSHFFAHILFCLIYCWSVSVCALPMTNAKNSCDKISLFFKCWKGHLMCYFYSKCCRSKFFVRLYFYCCQKWDNLINLSFVLINGSLFISIFSKLTCIFFLLLSFKWFSLWKPVWDWYDLCFTRFTFVSFVRFICYCK